MYCLVLLWIARIEDIVSQITAWELSRRVTAPFCLMHIWEIVLSAGLQNHGICGIIYLGKFVFAMQGN